MKSNLTLVAIFPGPAPYFRVRELAPGSIWAFTIQWFNFYDDAEQFVGIWYSKQEMCSPEAFKVEVKRRKGGRL